MVCEHCRLRELPDPGRCCYKTPKRIISGSDDHPPLRPSSRSSPRRSRSQGSHGLRVPSRLRSASFHPEVLAHTPDSGSRSHGVRRDSLWRTCGLSEEAEACPVHSGRHIAVSGSGRVRERREPGSIRDDAAGQGARAGEGRGIRQAGGAACCSIRERRALYGVRVRGVERRRR